MPGSNSGPSRIELMRNYQTIEAGEANLNKRRALKAWAKLSAAHLQPTRVVLLNPCLAQDCHPRYSTQVRAFEVTDATTEVYQEREVERSPELASGRVGWNA